MSLKALLIDLGNVVVFFDRRKVAEHFAAITGQEESSINYHLNESADGQARLAAFERGGSRNDFKVLTERVLGTSLPGSLFWAMHVDLFRANYPVINLLHRVKSLYPEIKLVAVTNTDEVRLERMLLLAEFAGILFDNVAASCYVCSRKPQQKIYQVAISLACVQKEECLFVDDILENCAAAEKNGIPSQVFSTLADLENALRERGLFPEERQSS